MYPACIQMYWQPTQTVPLLDRNIVATSRSPGCHAGCVAVKICQCTQLRICQCMSSAKSKRCLKMRRCKISAYSWQQRCVASAVLPKCAVTDLCMQTFLQNMWASPSRSATTNSFAGADCGDRSGSGGTGGAIAAGVASASGLQHVLCWCAVQDLQESHLHPRSHSHTSSSVLRFQRHY